MELQPQTDHEPNVETVELRGFTRSIAEIEWLLLILALLYYVSPGAVLSEPTALFISIVLFALFVMAFHYLNFFTLPARWKIAVETWCMIAFVSWVIGCTDGMASPLRSLYLLVIIASALTLGKLITFLELGLVSALYVYFGYPEYIARGHSLVDFSNFMIQIVPILLVAYVTIMLAADVHSSKRVLKTLSETDELTGLRNKRSFKAILGLEFKTASRYGRRFSIMMIDADNLKEVNDQRGHMAGDQLIKQLASTIQQHLRNSDTVARYGGDEFIVLLPEAVPEQAREVAERIRSAVNAGPVPGFPDHYRTSVSIGIAGYPEDSADTAYLVDCADQALYGSKNAGRNTITLYSEHARKAA